MRGERTLISVVLGAEKVKLADGKKTLTKSFSETSRLFDYGFDCFALREIVSASEPICEVPVALSSEANYVVVHPAETISRMLPKDLELSELQRDVTLYENVDAPIAAGDELGEMTVSYNGTTYAVVKLLALSDVSASWLLVAQRNVLNFLSRSVVKFVLAAAAVLIALVAVLHFGGRSRRYGKRSRRSAAASSGYRGRR